MANTIWANAVKIDDKKDNTNFTLGYFQDRTGKLDIKDVKKIKNFKIINNSFSMGYKKGNIWLRFSLWNTLPKKITKVLYFSEIFYNIFDFYILNPSGKLINIKRFGLLERGKGKDISISFRVSFKPHEKKIIFVKLNSVYSIVGSLKILNLESFMTEKNHQNYFYFIYFGVFLTVFIYNFFLYIYLKDVNYLIYVIYINTFFILVLQYSGFIFYIIDPLYYNKIQVAYPATFFILAIFTKRVLKVKRHLPFYDKIVDVINIFLIIAMIWVFLDIDTGFFAANLVATTQLFLLFVIGIISVKYDNITAKLYMMAIGFFIIGMLVFNIVILMFGFIPYNIITRNIPLVGSMLEMIFLSLVLASKIYTLKNDMIRTNRKLLNIKTNQNRLLTLKVESQTKDIKLLLSELNHRVKNNFQSILSFLHIQQRSFDDQNVIRAFDVASNRVLAVSYIHELLHNKPKKAFSFKTYIENFIELLFRDKKEIKKDISISNIKVSADDIMMLGMILNELITNSFKHAFLDTENPFIIIKFYEEEGYNVLYYKDNGCGISKDDIQRKERSGYKIIKAFAYKLKESSIELENSDGFTCIIRFKGV